MSERTEQPTPRRRQELRQKGQVARSVELASAFSLLAGLVALRTFGPWMYETMRTVAVNAFSHPYQTELTPEYASQYLLAAGLSTAKMMLPLATLACVAAVAASLLQTGFISSAQPLIPDFSRINPIQGAQRLFSLRGLTELVKSMLKLGLLGVVSFIYLRARFEELVGLSAAGGLQGVGLVGELVWGLSLRLAVVMLLIAIVDYLFQRRLFERSARMTREEVREDFRRSEGDPQVKARLRRLQQQLARGRMIQNVKQATVVVTNPVHLAIALRYEPQERPAPVVVAKGKRRTAERIQEEARLHRVPIVQNIPLAHALFESTEIGHMIPADLYQAVAEIIAFVYRLTGLPGRTAARVAAAREV